MYNDQDYKLAREHIKQTVTIPMVLERLLNIQCSNNQKINSPFRDEQHASFSIFDGGRRCKDHTSGWTVSVMQGTVGLQLDLLQL